jgi:hypothetical protein
MKYRVTGKKKRRQSQAKSLQLIFHFWGPLTRENPKPNKIPGKKTKKEDIPSSPEQYLQLVSMLREAIAL